MQINDKQVEKMMRDFHELEMAYEIACGRLEEYSEVFYGLYRLTKNRNKSEWKEYCLKLAKYKGDM